MQEFSAIKMGIPLTKPRVRQLPLMSFRNEVGKGCC